MFYKALKEIIATFSNQPSYLSSKRIERFIVFITMLSCSVLFLAINILKCGIGATDLMVVISVWLGYAGYNTFQIKKDVNNNNYGQNNNGQDSHGTS